MTQFKDKASRHSIILMPACLPIRAMAADILLYQTHLVPVGEDQNSI